jgi:glycosyltransferase involved in cell wall biosynthesis
MRGDGMTDPHASRPRVSVLMAVYNTARYLEAALTSVSTQTFEDFELIVVNDGSTDESARILSSYLAREPRMRLISRDNRGLIHTRNQLLQEAQGELVAWMDSDDISMPDRLRLQVDRFDADADLVCLGGAVEVIDPEGWSIGSVSFPLNHDSIVEAQKQGGGSRFPTVMMRTQCAREVGGFREPFAIGEDLDLFIRMSEKGHMANLPEVLVRYRQHPQSVSAVFRSRWTAYLNLILELAEERRAGGLDRLQRGEEVRVEAAKAEFESPATTHARWARRAMQNGNRAAAWKHALAAIKAEPVAGIGWRTFARVAWGAVLRE